MEQTFAAKIKQPQKPLMDNLTELLCHVDDFYQIFVPVWQEQQLTSGKIHRQRNRILNTSEVTLVPDCKCRSDDPDPFSPITLA
jgi:hypothetical protein